MSEALKNLGQSFPAAQTLTDMVTVGASKTIVTSVITACNQGDVPARFRISHAVAAAVDARAQYLYYDEVIPPKKSFKATEGYTFAATDVLRVWSDTGQVSFNAHGSEIT